MSELAAPYAAYGIYWTTGTNIAVKDCVLENNNIHMYFGTGTNNIGLDNVYMEGGQDYDIHIGDANSATLTNVYGNGTATSKYLLDLGSAANGVTITGCRTTAHTISAINYKGYLSSEIHQSGNKFGETNLGILADDTVNSLNKCLALPKATLLYPFADAYGDTVFDVSGNLKSATLIDTPTWGTLANGIGYIDLNGTSQYAIFPEVAYSAAAKANDDRTFLFAGFPDFSMGDAVDCALWSFRIDGNNFTQVDYISSHKFRFQHTVAGVSDYGYWTTPFTSTDLLVVEVSINATANNFTIYQNGSLVSSGSTSADMPSTSGRIYIGAHNGAGYEYNGKVCLFGEFPQVSTNNEMFLHYKHLSQIIEPSKSHIAVGEVRSASGALVPTGTCTATTVSGTFTESPLALITGANTMTCTASGTINVVMPAGSTAIVTSGDSTVTDSPKTCAAGATTLVTVTTGAGADTFTITVHSNAFAWHNPEAQDILIKKIVINRTAAGGTATAEMNVGIADNGTVDDPGTEFFENLLVNNAAAIHDSYVAGGTSYGTQTIWISCQDSASATGGWIVAKLDTEIANSVAGTYYIEYVGK
jgi:hypothetical protein